MHNSNDVLLLVVVYYIHEHRDPEVVDDITT